MTVIRVCVCTKSGGELAFLYNAALEQTGLTMVPRQERLYTSNCSIANGTQPRAASDLTGSARLVNLLRTYRSETAGPGIRLGRRRARGVEKTISDRSTLLARRG